MSPLLTLLLGILAGIGAGYVLFQGLERRRAGGKTVAELKQEHEAYRELVQQHFSKTSDLFQNVTMQYRGLYDHLASGAQSLCHSIPASPALHLSDKALLPETGVADEHAPEPDRSEDKPAEHTDDDVPLAQSVADQEEAAMGADAGVYVDTTVVDKEKKDEPAPSPGADDASVEDREPEASTAPRN